MINTPEVVALSDFHYPFQDDDVVRLELEFCRRTQPKLIIVHELHDFYQISHFDKDPDRVTTLQEEIDQVNEFFSKLRKVCPKSRIILLNSNHLDRLRKFLWKNAPALNSLRVLKIETLLELNKFNIEYKDTFSYKGILFKHGDLVRKYSGYTAKGEFEKEAVSGVSGHTHRLGVYWHKTRAGLHFWAEGGCGCNLDAEYIKGVANWSHGFIALQFIGNKCFPTAVPIINKKLLWGDMLIK